LRIYHIPAGQKTNHLIEKPSDLIRSKNKCIYNLTFIKESYCILDFFHYVSFSSFFFSCPYTIDLRLHILMAFATVHLRFVMNHVIDNWYNHYGKSHLRNVNIWPLNVHSKHLLIHSLEMKRGGKKENPSSNVIAIG
jgi:hypothetical protein